MANLPVIEGAKLKTGNGVAEVEFEDNSTIRVAQNSLVEFPRLELLPTGAKASAHQCAAGHGVCEPGKHKGQRIQRQIWSANGQPAAGQLTSALQVTPSDQVVSGGKANLAVMHGDVQVEEPSGSTTVGKNKTATFNLAEQSQPVIAKSVVDQPLDKWDSDAVQYHKSYANASSFGNSPYAYGINDLNYYGSFTSGCGGSMWRPYFTSASWDPFGSGAWAYYPSAGYSWVSPYPWGWTPYHYGSWSFCQGLGWGWQPGGAWMGLANNSFVNNSGGSLATSRPRPPLHPPTASEASLVGVNLKAIPASSLENDKFVFRNNSAGLGVPRGSLGKLNSFSGQAAQHGMATTNCLLLAASGVQPRAELEPASPAKRPRGYSASSQSHSSMQAVMQGSASAGASHSSMQSAPSGGGGGRR